MTNQYQLQIRQKSDTKNKGSNDTKSRPMLTQQHQIQHNAQLMRVKLAAVWKENEKSNDNINAITWKDVGVCRHS